MSMLSSSLKNLFHRPFTTRYPQEPAQLPPGNRGRILYNMEMCIFCRKCERNCPADAIITDPKAKTQTVIRNRCIACNTCVEVCPTHTISMSEEYSKPDTAPVVHVFSVDLPDRQYREEHLPRYEGHKEPPK